MATETINIQSQVIDSIADGDTTHAPSRNAVFDALVALSSVYAPLVSQLKVTTVKTGAYVAQPGDYIPVDTTLGVVPITLPTAPADGTIIAIKRVIGASNNVTYTTGGSDVLNIAGGSTSGTLQILNQHVTLVYKSVGAIWYVETSLSIGGLDSRYVLLTDPRLTDTRNVRILVKSQTAASHTGNTNNTKISTGVLLIPANTIQVGDWIMVEVFASKSGATNTAIVRMYFNNTDDLSTPIQIGTGTLASGNTFGKLVRTLFIRSATETVSFNNSASAFSDAVNNASGYSVQNVDWTVDQYFVVGGQLTNAGDTVGFEGAQVNLRR